MSEFLVSSHHEEHLLYLCILFFTTKCKVTSFYILLIKNPLWHQGIFFFFFFLTFSSDPLLNNSTDNSPVFINCSVTGLVLSFACFFCNCYLLFSIMKCITYAWILDQKFWSNTLIPLLVNNLKLMHSLLHQTPL